MHFGKWHLGAVAGSRPEQKGFDESLGFAPGASMYLPKNDPGVENSHQDFDPIDLFLWAALPWGVQFNGSPWFQPAGYMTDYLTDQAITAVHANRNRPFFLYFAPNAVHTPLQATKTDFDALPNIADHRLRVYAAMVRNLDRNIGRLLQSLKDEGLDRNTLVIFTSDNAARIISACRTSIVPTAAGRPRSSRAACTCPISFGGRRIFSRAPNTQRPSVTSTFFATAAAAAGAAMPNDRTMDGVDLLPLRHRSEHQPAA